MTNVMEGFRVLEVAEHTFVPAAAALLADWGAEVIKIEHVERGDAMRSLASTGLINLGEGVHVLLEHSNRGKKSLALDLATPEGVGILYELAASCDVFITNKLPSVRKRLGIDVDDIRAHNPRIVYVRGSGYGARGPDADAGGYDLLGFWARGGSAMGAKALEVDQLPTMPAPGYGDTIGAMTIAGGVVGALLHRERTGHAPIVDVSLLATGMWATGAAIALSLHTGQPWTQPPAIQTEPRNPIAGSYQTADGKFIVFSMLQYFQYWPEVCRRIGREDLIDDSRFATADDLMKNSIEAMRIVAAEIARLPLDEWKERLRGMKGQWSPAQDSLEVAEDPQVAANGYLQEVATAQGVPFQLVASPVQFDEEPSRPGRAPEFNEHGDEILQNDLGLSWDDVVALKLKGIVG